MLNLEIGPYRENVHFRIPTWTGNVLFLIYLDDIGFYRLQASLSATATIDLKLLLVAEIKKLLLVAEIKKHAQP